MDLITEIVVPVVLGLLSLIMTLFGIGARRVVSKVDDHEDRMQMLEKCEAANAETRKNLLIHIEHLTTGQTNIQEDIKRLLEK